MMTTDTLVCSSCAGCAIVNLSTNKDAKDAMLRFCSQNFGVPSRFSGRFSALSAFYVFIAGPEYKRIGRHGWGLYGTEFAAFIVENKLGQVATLGPKLNLKYHSSTTCQIWIWSPCQEAMEKWWRENWKESK